MVPSLFAVAKLWLITVLWMLSPKIITVEIILSLLGPDDVRMAEEQVSQNGKCFKNIISSDYPVCLWLLQLNTELCTVRS